MKGVLPFLGGVSSVLVLAVAAVGALHHPAARPLLALAGGCPVGEDAPLSRQELDIARARARATLVGVEPAPDRPAMGFVLDHSGRVDVQRWAVAHGVPCQPEPHQIVCANVPASATPNGTAARELVFELNGRDRVIGVAASLNVMEPEPALTWIRDAESQIGGTPTRRGDPGRLGAGALNQVASEYRFSDYRALFTATHLGSGRIATRAVWQSLRTR